MNRIEIIEIIKSPEFNESCIITGQTNNLERHHALYYGKNGKHINDITLNVTAKNHGRVGADPDSIHNCKLTKDYAEWVALNQVDVRELQIKYPKHNWYADLSRLDDLYLEGHFDQILRGRFKIENMV